MKKSLKTIAIAVAISFIGVVLANNYYSSQDDYADIGIQLSAIKSIDVGDVLPVQLKTENEGNMGIVPTFMVSVVNATIHDVEISGIQKHSLSDFCKITETTVSISNFTIKAGRQFSVLATIYVIPNDGASSFGVFSDATLPNDFFHPNNRVAKTPPFEFVYNITSQGKYVLSD